MAAGKKGICRILFLSVIGLFVILLFVILFAGSTVLTKGEEKQEKVAFETVIPEKAPAQFLERIQKEQEQPFQMFYESEGELYIAKGYGRQPSAGYSIEVDRLYETDHFICIHTSFRGPEKGGKQKKGSETPYVIIRTKSSGKDVWFE